MAKVSLEAIEQFSNNQRNSNQVNFFGLKDDGDEAVVRFFVDSINDIDIVTLHEANAGGKFLKISCNRESLSDNPGACAFCASGTKMVQKVFIKLLSYTKSATGEITAIPCIWERSTSYAIKLREYLNNYGPLSDLICKIVRHGAKGDLKTTYEIIPNLSKSIYPDNAYVKDFSAFANYKVVGALVKEKTNDEINVFLQTGQFPEVKKNVAEDIPEFPATPLVQQPVQQMAPNQQFAQAQVVQQTVTAAPVVQQVPQQTMPWQQTQQIQRPIRTY